VYGFANESGAAVACKRPDCCRPAPLVEAAQMLKRTILTVLAFLASAPLIGAETNFPGLTWDRPGLNAPEGWSPDKLRLAEALFQANRSTAVMVVHNGHVVAAWGDVARTVNVGSVKTSLLGALYGIGVAEGRIDLNRTLADLGIYDNEPASRLRREKPPFVIC
jgi:CubicO group peptidase (beta-lactamase class C family)